LIVIFVDVNVTVEFVCKQRHIPVGWVDMK